MPRLRVLLGMTLGAVIAACGALFLGEYEFDELLPILSGALLGLIVAEVVVSVGRHRSSALAVIVASWSATAVVLAGFLDSNETEPIKNGAYLSAGLAALMSVARVNDWRRRRPAPTPEASAPRRRPSPTPDPVAPEPVPEDAWARPRPAQGARPAPAPASVRARPRPTEPDARPDLPGAPSRPVARTARRFEPRPDTGNRGSDDRSERARRRATVTVTARRRPRTGRGR